MITEISENLWIDLTKISFLHIAQDYDAEDETCVQVEGMCYVISPYQAELILKNIKDIKVTGKIYNGMTC